MVAATVASGVLWFRQYTYWVNTGYVEYNLSFSLANHFGLVLLVSFLCWLVLVCFGKGRQTISRGFGSVSLFLSAIVILELLVRWTGVVQNYGETRDGRYIPQYDDTPRSAYYTYGRNTGMTMESGDEFRFERTTNGIGLLFKSALHKPVGFKRVIVLGDSFTAGDGAHKDSTWVSFMQRKLMLANERYALLEVLNAGVQGSDPIYQHKLLVDKLLVYEPDLVILAINNTDIGEIGSRGGFGRFVSDTLCIPRSGPWWEPVYASSHITRLVLRVIFGINYSLMTKDGFERNQERSGRQLQKVVEAYETLAKKNDFQLLVCFIPLRSDLKVGSFHSLFGLEERMSVCNQVDVECLNLFPSYLEEGISTQNLDKYYWPLDGHHKAEGYRVLGEAVAKQIVEKEVLFPS